MQRASIQARPVRRSAAPKVEWNNIGGSKTHSGVQQIREIGPKGNVKAQPLGTRPDLPQTEQRVASPTNLIESNPPLPKHRRKL